MSSIATVIPKEKADLEIIRSKFAPVVAKPLRAEHKDVFAPLGTLGPLMNAIFTAVQFPVTDRNDLVKKTGGPSRLVILTDDSATVVHSLADVLDAWPALDKFFPMHSAEGIVEQFDRLLDEHGKLHKSRPFLNISRKHLLDTEKVSIMRTAQPAPLIGFAAQSGTGAQLLQVLMSDRFHRYLSRELVEVVTFLSSFIAEQEKKAALAAASTSEARAYDAEQAQTQAWNITRNVGGTTTWAQAAQLVSEVKNFYDIAASSAAAAIAAAAEAAAHAGAIPGDVEAQNAAARALDAANRAQAAANAAWQAYVRAEDIGSIHFVVIHGHITEEDPVFDDDCTNATVTVENVLFPEIAAKTTTTDGNGNYAVTGRFGPSSRLGPSLIRVSFVTGEEWNNMSGSQQVYVNSDAPPPINFKQDAPGWE